MTFEKKIMISTIITTITIITITMIIKMTIIVIMMMMTKPTKDYCLMIRWSEDKIRAEKT